jgi:DNA-binding NarL/FixJ family response regulator
MARCDLTDANGLGDDLPPPQDLALERRDSTPEGTLLLSFPVARDAAPARAPVVLTPSERAVLRALLAGATNGQIAARRGVSPRTVANQVAALFRKVRVHSRLDLARIALHSELETEC